MENVIINSVESALPSQLFDLLPARVKDALFGIGAIEELRLSANRIAWVKKNGKNLPLNISLSANELEELVLDMCGGSLYAHTETIRHGFISLGGGLRVGLSGRAVMENGRVIGVRDISSLCVRIPHNVSVDVSVAVSVLDACAFSRGLLLYAPPAGGKTTFLRSLARCLASGENPRRVAVVDTRDELAFSLDSCGLCLDILSGYPKAYGIEIATRTLGAQVILCDEIGSEEDARAILDIQSSGVPLVASAHAGSVGDLMTRHPILSLHRAGVFGAYLGLSREQEPILTVAEAVDAYL